MPDAAVLRFPLAIGDSAPPVPLDLRGSAAPGSAAPANRFVSALHGVESGALVLAFIVSMLLPLIDAIGRPFGNFAIPGSQSYRAQLTLWLAFVGGLLATREHRHLTLSSAEAIAKWKVKDAARLL